MRLQMPQHLLKKLLLDTSPNQPLSNFTQHPVMKSGVSQFQTQQVLPVDPGAHRIRCLPVRYPFPQIAADALDSTAPETERVGRLNNVLNSSSANNIPKVSYHCI